MFKTLALLTRLALRLSTAMGKHLALLQLALGGGALGLGFWGWMLKYPAHDGMGLLSNGFRTLQLITLHFPTDFEADVSWQLQIARLLVPLVAASATFHILLGGLTRPLRLALLPFARDHVILYGDGEFALDALERLVQSGERHVVALAAAFDPARRETLEGLGLTVVAANPYLAATYRTVNLKAAAALFVASANDLDNINIAMFASRNLGGRDPERAALTLAVKIDREDLASELGAALDGLARRHGVRYHRLCPDREGLRSALKVYAPAFVKSDMAAPSHAYVLGLQGRWRQTLAELIIALQDHPFERPLITLALKARERHALKRWLADHPELELIARFEILAATIANLPLDADCERHFATHGEPDLIVVLLDDADAIAAALALRRPASPAAASRAAILLRQTRADFLVSALAGIEVKHRDHSRIVTFGGPIGSDSLARALDREGDEIAMALHAQYLERSSANPSGSPAAEAAWDDLPENLRAANRAAADHWPILFAAEGVDITDASAVRRAVEDPARLDRLARIEHRRWMADRIERGWRFGPARDDARLTHPSLRDFDRISAAEQEKDRAALRTAAAVLTAR